MGNARVHLIDKAMTAAWRVEERSANRGRWSFSACGNPIYQPKWGSDDLTKVTCLRCPISRLVTGGAGSRMEHRSRLAADERQRKWLRAKQEARATALEQLAERHPAEFDHLLYLEMVLARLASQ